MIRKQDHLRDEIRKIGERVEIALEPCREVVETDAPVPHRERRVEMVILQVPVRVAAKRKGKCRTEQQAEEQQPPGMPRWVFCRGHVRERLAGRNCPKTPAAPPAMPDSSPHRTRKSARRTT